MDTDSKHWSLSVIHFFGDKNYDRTLHLSINVKGNLLSGSTSVSTQCYLWHLCYTNLELNDWEVTVGAGGRVKGWPITIGKEKKNYCKWVV